VPFVTYYGYCHSLDGATLFSKVDLNKLRINVKNWLWCHEAASKANRVLGMIVIMHILLH